MSCRGVVFVKQIALLAAVLLLFVPQALAGPPFRAASRPVVLSPLPTTPVTHLARPTAAASVVLTVPAPAAADAVYVDLRGPDGQVRRFPLEGGRAAIQVQEVVLRPGSSVTIQWAAAK
jgi:hypothetical protein